MATDSAPHPQLPRYYADEGEHRRYLKSIFDETAVHYDRITSLMSFGSVRWYRSDALRRAGLEPGMQVLDVATGTGPVAQTASKMLGQGRVVGLDPSLGMLVAGLGSSPRPKICGRAEALPYRDGSFDFLIMGYALRHVETLESAFREYRRVLRPGGKLLILELTRPPAGWRRRFTQFYMGKVVPALSGLIARDRRAHELMAFYWDTIDNCVAPETIVEALERSGLQEAKHWQKYGVLSEYVAQR